MTEFVPLSPILERCGDQLFFECPGCKMMHGINVGVGPGPRWDWNGSADHPTFTPSILVTGVEMVTDEERERLMAGEKVEPRPLRCHSFVTDGRIQFLSDCTHALAGSTVPLPEIEQ